MSKLTKTAEREPGSFAERLTPKNLQAKDITARGGKILRGKGQLVLAPNHEGREYVVNLADDIVIPNPKQPRKYFNEKKLQEIALSIATDGQQSATVVTLCELDGGDMKGFIVDGERRFRAIKRLNEGYYDDLLTERKVTFDKTGELRIVVRYAEDEETILKRSLILNESKDDHNPIERATSYQELIAFKKKKKNPHPVESLAQELGLSDQTIYNHLRLLDLPKDIQKMVMEGQLPAYGALQITSAKGKYGEKLNMVRLAARLVELLKRDATTKEVDAVQTTALTGRGIRQQLEAVLLV